MASEKFSGMGAIELWQTAQHALAENRLRDAKEALDQLGLRFDDAYARLEQKLLEVPEQAGKVWS